MMTDDPVIPATGGGPVTPHLSVSYGDRVPLVHKGVAPLTAGDIVRLARNIIDLGIPSTALIEVRTPINRDRRNVDLAVWVVDTNTEGNEHQHGY